MMVGSMYQYDPEFLAKVFYIQQARQVEAATTENNNQTILTDYILFFFVTHPDFFQSPRCLTQVTLGHFEFCQGR